MYLIVLIVWEGWTYWISTILALRWITFFLPLGFIIGLLPPLIPFLIYLVGILNVHILGTSESGSMLKTFLWFGCWSLFAFLISLIFLGNDRATIIVTCFFAFVFSNELLFKIPLNVASKIPKEIKTQINYHFKSSQNFKPWNCIPWILLTLTYFLVSIGSVIPSCIIKFKFEDLKIVGYTLSAISYALSWLVWACSLSYKWKTLYILPLCNLKCWVPVHVHLIRLF